MTKATALGCRMGSSRAWVGCRYNSETAFQTLRFVVHLMMSADSTMQMQILGSTAGQTVRNAIDASREPPVEHLKEWYQNTEQEPSSTADFWKLCEERESYRARYNEYWNATRSRTRSKRPVDGVIMPVAPTAAVEHMQFKYYGKHKSGGLMKVDLIYWLISGEGTLLSLICWTIPAAAFQ